MSIPVKDHTVEEPKSKPYIRPTPSYAHTQREETFSPINSQDDETPLETGFGQHTTAESYYSNDDNDDSIHVMENDKDAFLKRLFDDMYAKEKETYNKKLAEVLDFYISYYTTKEVKELLKNNDVKTYMKVVNDFKKSRIYDDFINTWNSMAHLYHIN